MSFSSSETRYPSSAKDFLPLVKKDGMPEYARKLSKELLGAGINARYDEQHAIGKRYRRHDEAGTPFCITVDGESLSGQGVTIRDRDTMAQTRLAAEQVKPWLQERLGN